jgi:hypothetical protein
VNRAPLQQMLEPLEALYVRQGPGAVIARFTEALDRMEARGVSPEEMARAEAFVEEAVACQASPKFPRCDHENSPPSTRRSFPPTPSVAGS